VANKIAYHSVVIDDAGIGKLATITIYDAGTLNLSTIYSAPAGAAQVNPFATDANGRFVFYANPAEYDIAVSGIGLVPYKLFNVSVIGIFDQFITSNPPSTEYQVKRIRLDATNKVVVVYDDVPEP
jgi:hypothetical protein